MTVHTADTNPVRPLLEQVCPAGTNIVVTHGGIVTCEGAFGDVQTRPATGIVRVDIFNELVGVRPSHFNVRASRSRGSPCTCTVDLGLQA